MYKHTLLRFIYVLMLMALVPAVYGQDTSATTKVELKHADFIDYNEPVYGKVRRLIGGVHFQQEDITMYCDSAFQNEEDNSFTAYSNVKIYQGDSLSLFGDTLFYDGTMRHALLMGKIVTLNDKQMTLTTDSLNYNMVTGMAFYTTGGHIVNKENDMVSEIGTYDTKSKTVGFKNKIVLKNPKYTMYSDTLQYNTTNQYAYFFGPTRIITVKDSTIIYCENGWYNTKINYSQIKTNAYIETKDKKLNADSMVYTGKTAIDQAYGNILLVDTTNKMEIHGQRGTYNRNTNTAWITVAAWANMKAEDDTLYITADTLKTWFDSVRQNRTMYAFHNTKFFKKDLQGQCDSLQYSLKDSVINMEGLPLLWSDKNQITADTLRVFMKNGQVSHIKMLKNTFIASEKDSVKYNQIKGRNAEGFFADKKLRQVNVNNDVENIYYIEEDTGKYMGMYKVACGTMRVIIEDNKVTEVYYHLSPAGDLHPMDKIPAGEDRLKGFSWQDNKRPKTYKDIIQVYTPPVPVAEKPIEKKPAEKKPEKKKKKGL